MYADTELRAQEARNLSSRLAFALQLVQSVMPPGSKILDVGCGPGEIAAKLIECGYEVWGVDVAEPMILRARIRCGSDRFRVGDIESIPFPDSTFDAVVCLAVIEYLDSDEAALAQIRRVLKPGGRAVIAAPNAIAPLQNIDRACFTAHQQGTSLARSIKACLSKRAVPQVESLPDQSRGRRYSRRKLVRALRSFGFSAEETLCYGWGWYRTNLLATAANVASKSMERIGELALGRNAYSAMRRAIALNPILNWMSAEHMLRVRLTK